MSVLIVDKIVTGYSKEVDVLHEISFEIKEKECIALIGANGAGKSSIMKTISGILPCKSGSIIFKGEHIEKLKPHEIVARGIVQVPEEGGVFPNLTIKENLMINCNSKITKQYMKQNMELVYSFFPPLLEKENQFAGILSGGQRKMLNIGKAIMSKPELLLLDDISMGLAPKVVEDLYDMLKELMSELNKPVLLVEQIADIALNFAEYGHVVSQGEIAMSGKSSELLNSEEVQRVYVGS
ncbi:MAG: ABC transporter ATP-binding protein [Clostridia bacterium]